MAESGPRAPVFRERLTSKVVGDALVLGAIPLGAGVASALLGWGGLAIVCLAASAFVAFFFRNPERALPADPRAVVAPADGRVIEVGEIEAEDGRKRLRIGVFLSVFDVHVNRAPVAGRVVSIERGGRRFLAAFDRRAERENVRCAMTLETAGGARVGVVQIAGLIARRIVCQPQAGEWLERGVRYGLIRFGSRTDVWLPLEAEPRVAAGDRVRGGASVIAVLTGAAP
ncbi:MAG TPA: phosphatidylserine decarboxylase [Myxococcota bacterium]|nr:phosphatidylserine decarboxylase [Myxococcota bacterium]